MKATCFLLTFLLLGDAQSASVLWNEGFELVTHSNPSEGWGGGGVCYSWENELGVLCIYNDFGIPIDKTESDTGRCLYGEGIDVGRLVRLIVANVGDDINHETVADDSRLFLTNTGPYGPYTQLSYDGREPWTLYLGFETVPWGMATSGVDGQDVFRVYGWMEIFVDDYTLRLGNTCLDLTDRPVVVGVRSEEPVPEPASGTLALLGAMLLFRRKRGKGKCRPSRSDLRLIAARALPPASSRR